jgi:hypothetical protein
MKDLTLLSCALVLRAGGRDRVALGIGALGGQRLGEAREFVAGGIHCQAPASGFAEVQRIKIPIQVGVDGSAGAGRHGSGPGPGFGLVQLGVYMRSHADSHANPEAAACAGRTANDVRFERQIGLWPLFNVRKKLL